MNPKVPLPPGFIDASVPRPAPPPLSTVWCLECEALVPARPARDARHVIRMCPTHGNTLVQADTGHPLPTGAIAQPARTDTRDLGPPLELPSDAARRRPPLKLGECRAIDAIGGTIRHPDYPHLPARVPDDQPGLPGWVWIENAALGKKQLPAATPVEVIPDVPDSETNPVPIYQRGRTTQALDGSY
jgi:hypothetical protein